MDTQDVVSERKYLIVQLKLKRKNPEVTTLRLLFYDRASKAHMLSLWYTQANDGRILIANAKVQAPNFPQQIAEVQAALKELNFVFPSVEG